MVANQKPNHVPPSPSIACKVYSFDVKIIHKENKITKGQAESAVNTFFNEMAGALSKGERVEIRGLGSFHVRKYKAYIGKNPKTLEKVKVKPKKRPFFKCGRELKKRVDYK